jgi:hypothetical protein
MINALAPQAQEPLCLIAAKLAKITSVQRHISPEKRAWLENPRR